MTLHPATWHQIFNASQTSAHVVACARRLRQRSSPHAPCVLPSATEPSRRLLHLFGTVCRIQYVHRRHYQFSTEDWRLNFLSGLTAVLPHERLTVLTIMWPHIIVTCPCSPRTLCHVKSNRYHHHHHHHHHQLAVTIPRLAQHCAVKNVETKNKHIFQLLFSTRSPQWCIVPLHLTRDYEIPTKLPFEAWCVRAIIKLRVAVDILGRKHQIHDMIQRV